MQYKLKFQNEANHSLVSIYFGEIKSDGFELEIFMDEQKLIDPIHLWQAFDCKADSKNGVSIKKGMFLTKDMLLPQTMSGETLKGFDGVMFDDFVILNLDELNKFSLGLEEVFIGGIKIKATHYRKTRNGQTVDFWIDPNLKPLGLVKMISSNESKAHQNYMIEMESKIKSVKLKIDLTK